MADRPPSEIARETLKQLAIRRLQPTPDNYLALYDEIAETRSPQPFPEGPLSQILRVLPGQTPAQSAFWANSSGRSSRRTGRRCKAPWSATPTWG